MISLGDVNFISGSEYFRFFIEEIMTVSTITNKVSYIGNGIATEFAIPFPFLETAHLNVYQLLNDIQTQREDWRVQNGNLIFETAPANGAQIVILREVPFTQETDYRENEILAAETLERNFDNLTMQVQQLKEQADRAVTVDIFDNTQASELLPSIRTSVSNAASYAQTASKKADDAQQASATATAQAVIATNKANEAASVLSNKAEKDLSNCTRPYIVETYRSGTEWYRVWSDGWKEQGGRLQINASTYIDITFLKAFTDRSYMLSFSHSVAGTGGQAESYAQQSTSTYFRLGNSCGNSQYFTWSACGY